MVIRTLGLLAPGVDSGFDLPRAAGEVDPAHTLAPLKNTQVVLTGVSPGGESKVASRAAPSRMPSAKPKVASKAGPRSRYVQAVPSWNGRGDELQRRRGLFGRLFGGP